MKLHRRHFLFLAAFCNPAVLLAQPLQTTTVSDDFRAIVQTTDGVVGLNYSSEIYASNNASGNFSFTASLSTNSLDVYYSMAALDNTVVAVGTDGLIARSTDGGLSWNPSVNTNFISGDLRTVSAKSGSGNSWLAAGSDSGSGVVFYSSDDAATWSMLASIDELSFYGSVWTGSFWLVCGLDESSVEGVVYRSENGTEWDPVSLPSPTAPLLSLAADGAGNVVVVGESGTILYSSDHGESFVLIGNGLVSEDFPVAVANGVDQFVIGGGGKSLLEVTGPSLSIIREPVGGAPEIEALLPVGSEIFAGGDFSSEAERSIPFDLNVSVNGNSYQLAVEESLPGKVYTLQSSTDLSSWISVESSSIVGSGNRLEWVQPANGSRRFWRVEEF